MVCGDKRGVFKHVHRFHGDTHSDFTLEEVLPLTNVENYYQYIKKVNNPCDKVKTFIKRVEASAPRTPKKKAVVKPSVMKSGRWQEMQSKLDSVADNNVSQKSRILKQTKRQNNYNLH